MHTWSCCGKRSGRRGIRALTFSVIVSEVAGSLLGKKKEAYLFLQHTFVCNFLGPRTVMLRVSAGLRFHRYFSKLRVTGLLASRSMSSSEASEHRWKAVMFDAGGVLTLSPFPVFGRLEHKCGLGDGALTKVISEGGEQGAFRMLERGELTVPEFATKFKAEVASATGKEFDASELIGELEEVTSYVMPEMLDAVQCIRAEGLKTAVITNNWLTGNVKPSWLLGKSLFNEVMSLQEVCSVN